jgi:hypothetical protein
MTVLHMLCAGARASGAGIVRYETDCPSRRLDHTTS